MKILVTGACGFIGSRLTEALVNHGHTVVGIDNLSTGRIDNFPAGVELDIGDIRQASKIRQDSWDVIYHCAASYKDRNAWETDATTNVLGTINVVREAMRTGAKLVYFQTSLCYGLAPKSPVTVGAPLDPRGSYAVSKTAGETYIRDSGVPFVSLRLANMYGPRNLSGPVPAFFKRLSAGEPCTIVNSRRDFVFVDDLIWVAVNAAKQGQGIYHVSSGADVAIADIYSELLLAMELKNASAPIFQERGPDDVATILLDPSKTTDEFGWTAQTPLAVGIREAVKWYRSHSVTDVFTHLSMATPSSV